MKTFAALSFFVTLAAQVAALTVNTPASLVQCEPAQLTWTNDGTAPYFLTIIPGGQVSASPLKEFPQTSDTSVTWTVDIAAGTSVTIALRDSTGNQVFTQAVTIQSSSISSCVNTSLDEGGATSGSGSASGTTTGAVTTTGASSSVSSGTSTTAVVTTGTTTGVSSASTTGTTTGSATSKASGTTTGTASTSAASTSTSANAAVRGSSIGTFGVAGLVGLIGAALF